MLLRSNAREYDKIGRHNNVCLHRRLKWKLEQLFPFVCYCHEFVYAANDFLRAKLNVHHACQMYARRSLTIFGVEIRKFDHLYCDHVLIAANCRQIINCDS
ncbi:hypothetical protein Sinac_4152 [Singulisphaera acidiphila DSM 18658]|uniref:Uncharacterized protein n=1 Tax=Singulisphaera acidiphila (strain ATCC BAA-1392 / DSM 18658 / VKM B-2454 / MOB10) TaxID=886293 RepID=L0DHP4_SINAD|nr:hypothetical protein Sinac_4152 [Singulisphaera acidiphila DSM 18658]